MKTLLAFALLTTATTAVAWDRWDVESSGRNFGGGNEVEMRPRYNYDYTQRYRGDVDAGGNMQLRNPHTGNKLRGYVDDTGYGRLRDRDGNTWRVKPR